MGQNFKRNTPLSIGLWLFVWLLLPLIGPAVTLPTAAWAQTNSATSPEPQNLVFQDFELRGNKTVSRASVSRALGLPLDRITSQDQLLDAVDRLRRTGLYSQVDFFTRPGDQRGQIILVLEVVERDEAPASSGFRFGTGNSDLDGWYLIPLEWAAQNKLGRGENMEVQFRIGYRHMGIRLGYQENTLAHGRAFWGGRLSSFNTKRIYFLDGLETAHRVDRSALDLFLGKRLGNNWTTTAGLKLETVQAWDFAEYYQDSATRNVSSGDRIPNADLPADIVADMGKRSRLNLRWELELDTRATTLLAATPTSGLWGRFRLETTQDDEGTFPGAGLNLRLFQKIGGGVLALQAKGAAVGDKAPFYDRLYLGGLYTVRGFPSQSLTRPEGDTWLWHTNLEFRAPLLGHGAYPRLSGALFLDVGQSGSFTEKTQGSVAMGAGWGLRLRVFDRIYLGLDAGLPLTDSPAAEVFHGNLSLGWNF